MIDWLIDWLIDLIWFDLIWFDLINGFVDLIWLDLIWLDWLIDWLTAWNVGIANDLLIDGSMDWFLHSFIGWLTDSIRFDLITFHLKWLIDLIWFDFINWLIYLIWFHWITGVVDWFYLIWFIDWLNEWVIDCIGCHTLI